MNYFVFPSAEEDVVENDFDQTLKNFLLRIEKAESYLNALHENNAELVISIAIYGDSGSGERLPAEIVSWLAKYHFAVEFTFYERLSDPESILR